MEHKIRPPLDIKDGKNDIVLRFTFQRIYHKMKWTSCTSIYEETIFFLNSNSKIQRWTQRISLNFLYSDCDLYSFFFSFPTKITCQKTSFLIRYVLHANELHSWLGTYFILDWIRTSFLVEIHIL